MDESANFKERERNQERFEIELEVSLTRVDSTVAGEWANNL